MKSFFKKLAFVMALAMVVSMAAPAAANAAVVLNAAYQNTDTFVTELEMEVGQKIDLCFKGAPKGWRELNRGWKVTSGDAVTVDNDGWVTAVANGEATIEFFMEGCESAVVTITVGEEDTYEGYAQTYPNTVEFYIGGDLSKVTKSDVKLYRVFTTADGKEVTVSWPAKGVAGTTEGKLTLTTFTNFSDNGQYRITFNGTDYDFATVIPKVEEITFIETTYGFGKDAWGNDIKDNFQAYVTEEDDEDELITNFGYKVWYYHEGSMINVTSLFGEEDLSIEYEMVTPTDDDEEIEYISFDTEGTIVFGDVVPAYVQAVASYETDDGEVPLATNGIEVVPTKRAELAVQDVIDWAFVKTSVTKSKDFTWNLKTIPAGETDDYVIVLKIQDTRGQIYVTRACASADGAFAVLGDDESDPLEDLEYSVKYYSTNDDDFLIDEETGLIRSYKKVNDAVFYVDLWKVDEEDDEDKKVDTIFAAEFKLGAPRKFDSVYPAKKTVNVVADAINGEDDYLEAEIKITALDQYGDPYYASNAYWKISCSDKDAEGYRISSFDKKNPVVKVNGAELYASTGDTSLTFTFYDDNSSASTTFKVNIGKPQWVDKDQEADKTNVAEGYFSENKPEGKEKHSWDLIIDQFKADGTAHDAITFGVVQNYPITWLGSGGDSVEHGFGFNTEYSRDAIVGLYKTSNKQIVGHHDLDAADSKVYTLSDKKWNDTTTGIIKTVEDSAHKVAVGDRLVMLYRNGSFRTPFSTKLDRALYELQVGSDGEITIPMTAHYTDETNRVEAGYAGTYEVIVYTVTEVEPNSKGEIVFDYEKDSITFTVQDQRQNVTLGSRNKIKSDYAFNAGNAKTWAALDEDQKLALKNVVLDTFSFKLGGNSWGLSLRGDDKGTNEGVNSTSVINSIAFEYVNGKVIIKSVEFNVPVDYSAALVGGEDYYRTDKTVVAVNMSVETK